MNVLVMENVTKVYGVKTLLDQVSLGVNEGDKIGVIGVNGTGKSTFLKIVAGLVAPDDGQIVMNNDATIAYLPQTPTFEPGETILQYVIKNKVSSNPNWSIEAEAKSILNKLCLFDPDQVVDDMSGGEKKRIALARTLVSPAKILVLDEPTNHLDNGMVEWLEQYLAKFTGVLLMVTHDRYFLDRVTNKIVEIDQSKLYSYDANYSGYLELRQQRMDSEVAANRKRQSILRTELEWVRRGAQARSTKQKARLERFQEMSEMSGPKQEKTVEMDSIATRLGKKTIEINNVTKGFGDRTLIRDFTYYTLKNDRIGFVGHNGCGKSTLLKMIMGELAPDEGYIEKGETLKIGYFAQETKYINPEQKVIDAIRDIAEYIQTTKGLASASQMLERFLFTPEEQYTQVGKLSGGEQRRLYLLQVLMTAPNVLILDEPTNDLDIATLTILEDYLDSFQGIVITVSHDRYFLDRIVNRIFAFEEDGTITQYEGDYSDYLERVGDVAKQQNQARNEGQATKKESMKTWKKREDKIKFTYQEQKEYDTIDQDIADLEQAIEELDGQMIEFASQYTKLADLSKEKEEKEQQLEEKMDRWVYLNDLAEQIANQ